MLLTFLHREEALTAQQALTPAGRGSSYTCRERRHLHLHGEEALTPAGRGRHLHLQGEVALTPAGRRGSYTCRKKRHLHLQGEGDTYTCRKKRHLHLQGEGGTYTCRERWHLHLQGEEAVTPAGRRGTYTCRERRTGQGHSSLKQDNVAGFGLTQEGHVHPYHLGCGAAKAFAVDSFSPSHQTLPLPDALDPDLLCCVVRWRCIECDVANSWPHLGHDTFPRSATQPAPDFNSFSLDPLHSNSGEMSRKCIFTGS